MRLQTIPTGKLRSILRATEALVGEHSPSTKAIRAELIRRSQIDRRGGSKQTREALLRRVSEESNRPTPKSDRSLASTDAGTGPAQSDVQERR